MTPGDVEPTFADTEASKLDPGLATRTMIEEAFDRLVAWFRAYQNFRAA